MRVCVGMSACAYSDTNESNRIDHEFNSRFYGSIRNIRNMQSHFEALEFASELNVTRVGQWINEIPIEWFQAHAVSVLVPLF